MSYINPNPEHTEQQILDLIRKVRQGSSPAIDGEVLANVLELCHLCGLTKQELINLRIGDVISKGAIAKQGSLSLYASYASTFLSVIL